MVAITVSGDADLDSRGPGGGDVGWGVSHHQAVFRFGFQSRHGGKDDVGRRFAGEAVSALDLIKKLQQSELFEDSASGRSAFGGRSGFARSELSQTLDHSRVDVSLLVTAAQVSGTVVRDQLLALLQGESRKDLGETFVQVQTNKAPKVREIDGAAGGNFDA